MAKDNNKTLPITEVVFREDIYPRFKPNPVTIQDYAENIEALPPIEISQNNELIDGYHRLQAHKAKQLPQITCIVTEVKDDMHLQMLAVSRNARHGLPMTTDEKKKLCNNWFDKLEKDEIIKLLSIGETSYYEWTKDKREQKDKEITRRIREMWLSCYTEQEIADKLTAEFKTQDKESNLGIDQPTVSRKIAEFMQNSATEFPDFTPQLYSVWNFNSKIELRHFGNIPPEIIENLLYYYTKPFDVVFDPFGGSGSTIDKCIAHQRRYYVSDLTPPATRPDMRQWNITKGLPEDLPVPDFVFLDPPYWKQAEGRYSDKTEDLANMELDEFLGNIASIVKNIKRKWGDGHPDAKLALIIGIYKKDGAYTDLPFLCYDTIIKYLPCIMRIQVPYNTQIHGGKFVKLAKEKREILYLSRDLMVFGQ